MSPKERNSAILIGCMLIGMASGAIAAANDYLFRGCPWKYDEPQYSEDLNFQYIWRVDTPTMDVDGDGKVTNLLA